MQGKIVNSTLRNDYEAERFLHARLSRAINADAEIHLETRVDIYYPNLNCMREERKMKIFFLLSGVNEVYYVVELLCDFIFRKLLAKREILGRIMQK